MSVPTIDPDAFMLAFMREFSSRVIRRTPVLSGRLQSEWKTTINNSGGELRNDTPYAGFVEYGTSKMEPRAMLRTTVEEIPQIVQQVKDSLIKR